MGYVKNKIDSLRKQPEHVRLRAATIMTASAGAVIGLVWVFLLLPLQLSFGNFGFSSGGKDTNIPAVLGESTALESAVPTPSEILPSISPTPSSISGQDLQLPQSDTVASEDVVE